MRGSRNRQAEKESRKHGARIVASGGRLWGRIRGVRGVRRKMRKIPSARLMRAPAASGRPARAAAPSGRSWRLQMIGGAYQTGRETKSLGCMTWVVRMGGLGCGGGTVCGKVCAPEPSGAERRAAVGAGSSLEQQRGEVCG